MLGDMSWFQHSSNNFAISNKTIRDSTDAVCYAILITGEPILFIVLAEKEIFYKLVPFSCFMPFARMQMIIVPFSCYTFLAECARKFKYSNCLGALAVSTPNLQSYATIGRTYLSIILNFRLSTRLYSGLYIEFPECTYSSIDAVNTEHPRYKHSYDKDIFPYRTTMETKATLARPVAKRMTKERANRVSAVFPFYGNITEGSQRDYKEQRSTIQRSFHFPTSRFYFAFFVCRY